MSDSQSRVLGQPTVTTAVAGSFSLVLAMVLQLLGFFDGAKQSLWEFYEAQGFGLGELASGTGKELFIVAILVFSIAWVMCEVPGLQRRVLILISSLTLIALSSPILALWGIFWSPFAAIVACVWTGFCSILWASQHLMPCETVDSNGAKNSNVISIVERQEESKRKRS